MRSSYVRFLCLCVVLFFFAKTPAFGTLFSWKSIGPDGAAPGSLVEHPDDARILLMTSPLGGVFRSIDGGRTWKNCTRGLPSQRGWYFYGGLSIGRQNPHPIYLTVSAPWSGLIPPTPVWTSTDLGETWQPVKCHGNLVTDPFFSKRLYTTNSPGGHTFDRTAYLRLSTDGGENWRPVYQADGAFLAVYPHPAKPGVIFMLKRAWDGKNRLLRSADGGGSWAAIHTFPGQISNLAFDPLDPERLYIGSSEGVYVSETGGSLWGLREIRPGNGNISWLDVRSDGSLLVRADGVYKSTDQGISWSALAPLPEGVTSIVASRHDSKVLFGLREDQLLRSDDEGGTWRPIDRGISNYWIRQIAFDGHQPGKIFLLAQPPSYWSENRLFRSTDSGRTWTSRAFPPGWFEFLRLDPRDSTRMYVGSWDELWTSADEGETWNPLDKPGEILDLFIDPLNGDLLVGTRSGVYSSTDHGATWTKRSDDALSGFAAMPGGALLAYSSAAIHRSTDSGRSWKKISDRAASIIAADPQNPKVAYMRSSDSPIPVWKTYDAGETWQPVSFGLTGAPDYATRTIIPSVLAVAGNMVIAGSESDGIYISDDAGASWHPYNDGLSQPLVTALAVDPNNSGAVYLGTAASGVFSLVSKRGNRFAFPVLIEDDRTSTGVALTNTRSWIKLELSAHAPNGSVVPGRLDIVEGLEQIARTGRELFDLNAYPLPPGGGWFQMDTTADLAPIFVLVGDEQADGSAPVSQFSKTLYFSRVYQGKSAFRGQDAVTTLSIVNPNDHPMRFLASLVGPDGKSLAQPQSYQIEKQGVFRRDVGSIFGADLVLREGLVRVDVQDPFDLAYPYLVPPELDGLSGFELIEFPQARTCFGLTAHTILILDSAYSAQLSAVPGAMTNLKLVNVTPESRTVKLEAVDEQGHALVPPVVLDIPGGTSIERDVSELFAFGLAPVVGSLRLTPDGGGLVGDILFGDFERFERASALCLETKTSTRLVFGQVANAMGYYTGLAVLNPGEEPADVKVRVLSAEGQKTGETILTLPPGGRASKLLTELVPETAGQVRGYLILESNTPIVAQELFATEKLLAAVPGSVE